MRAQNEAPETVVRLVRGEIEGEPTDVPGAWRVARVDEEALAEGRIWPQSRGSQLAGLAVGSRRGERVLDLCAAPGGKATMLAGEVVAVELHEGRARELEENVRRLGATNVRVVNADGLALPRRARRLRPRAGRCAVLRPGRAGRAAGPALARTGRCRSSSSRLLQAAAARVKPGGTVIFSVCTLNTDENEAVVEASGLAVDDLGAEWPAVPPPEATASSCSRRPHRHGTSGFFVARLRV